MVFIQQGSAPPGKEYDELAVLAQRASQGNSTAFKALPEHMQRLAWAVSDLPPEVLKASKEFRDKPVPPAKFKAPPAPPSVPYEIAENLRSRERDPGIYADNPVEREIYWTRRMQRRGFSD